MELGDIGFLMRSAKTQSTKYRQITVQDSQLWLSVGVRVPLFLRIDLVLTFDISSFLLCYCLKRGGREIGTLLREIS